MGKSIDRIMEGGAKKKFGLFMIHGFSGSNEEFNDLEEFFKNKGVAVKAPMLLGHGTTPEDMIARSPEDWIRQIEIELDEFFKQADNIFLGGISFGGNLAIQIAGKNKNIRGLFLLGTVIYFYNHFWGKLFIPILRYFKTYYTKRINPKHFFDKAAMNRRKAYPVAPLKNVVEMFRFIDRRTKKELPLVDIPTMILHSTHDNAVNPKSADYIFKNIGSSVKEIKWVNHSHHNLVIDRPRQEVFQAMYDFMIKNEKIYENYRTDN